MAAPGPANPTDFRSYNRGPLTTTFTLPSSCLATTSEYIAGWADPPSQRVTSYYIGFWPPSLPDYLPYHYDGGACLPSAATTTVDIGGQWYYSPGICPSSYTPAVSLGKDPLPTIEAGEALPRSVTAWLCCPLNYAPAPGMTDAAWSETLTCTSTAPGPATLTSVWPISSGGFAASSVWPIPHPTSDVKPTSVVTNPTVIAMGIPIMWESTDTQVQSWLDSYQTTSSPPGVKPTSSKAQTSKALGRRRAVSRAAAIIGALSLVSSLVSYS